MFTWGEEFFDLYAEIPMDYRAEAPPILRDFLMYHETIQGHSRKTVDEYYLDLRNFFRYIKIERGFVPRSAELDEISVEDVDLSLVASVSAGTGPSIPTVLRPAMVWVRRPAHERLQRSGRSISTFPIRQN